MYNNTIILYLIECMSEFSANYNDIDFVITPIWALSAHKVDYSIAVETVGIMIGVSLSEPHINGKALCEIYVCIYIWYNRHIPYIRILI